MAHTNMRRDKPGQAIEGQSEGSRGASYYHTTDTAGVISCTCPDFMTGKTAKGAPVEARVCKHLRSILDGDYRAFTPHGKKGSALGMADEIKKELGDIERVLLMAKKPGEITAQLSRLSGVKAKAVAFVDKLEDEIGEVNAKVAQAVKTAEEKL